jgi:hypothetical protein
MSVGLDPRGLFEGVRFILYLTPNAATTRETTARSSRDVRDEGAFAMVLLLRHFGALDVRYDQDMGVADLSLSKVRWGRLFVEGAATF